MIKILYFIIISFILISCSKKNKITTITLSSDGCHGECSKFAIELDNSLNVKYFGGEYSKSKGYYKSNIPNRDWNEISSLINSINLNKTDSIYENNNDFDYYELIINGKENHSIKGFLIDMPENLQIVFKKIILLKDNLKLVRANNNLTFKTKLRNIFYLDKITP
jgi:hypothetical protein